jgi:hypothetical protein
MGEFIKDYWPIWALCAFLGAGVWLLASYSGERERQCEQLATPEAVELCKLRVSIDLRIGFGVGR